MASIADALIIDPNTGEVIAEPGDERDEDILYRLEHLAYIQAAEDAGRAAGASHRDGPASPVFWRVAESGKVQITCYQGSNILKWLDSWMPRIPEWAGELRQEAA
jgi:hypothetical protein